MLMCCLNFIGIGYFDVIDEMCLVFEFIYFKCWLI